MAAERAGDGREGDELELVHPVYLDIPMMVSFVAAVEGGVAYGDESTRRVLSGTDKDREATAGGRSGIPLLSSILNLDMSGRLAQKERGEETEEVKVVRKHTEASLFNLLRHGLLVSERITTLDNPDQLAGLEVGALVEVSGEVVGNPLQQMLDLMTQLLPYMGMSEEDLRKPTRKSGRRSGNPAVKAAANQGDGGSDDEISFEEIVRMLVTMRDDLAQATVRDLMLQAPGGLRAALTLSTEFFTNQTTDYLLGGRFTAIGKVTRVLTEGESINLTRRTALGISGPDVARDLVRGFVEDKDFFVEIGDPIVEPPAIQLLPLAVFV